MSLNAIFINLEGSSLFIRQRLSVFNVEAFNTCQMPFWPSKKLFVLALHKNVLCKFSLVTMKVSPKTACHKTQWLQFANGNIVGFQSWHSSRHFQIPITPAISTQHRLQLRLGKHNYMWTWIFQTKLGGEWPHESLETWNIRCIDASIIMWSSDGKYELGLNFDTWKLTKNWRTLPLELDDD